MSIMPDYMRDLAIVKAKELIGPESQYSKIGRERRKKLRAKIVEALLEFYRRGSINA